MQFVLLGSISLAVEEVADVVYLAVFLAQIGSGNDVHFGFARQAGEKLDILRGYSCQILDGIAGNKRKQLCRQQLGKQHEISLVAGSRSVAKNLHCLANSSNDFIVLNSY